MHKIHPEKNSAQKKSKKVLCEKKSVSAQNSSKKIVHKKSAEKKKIHPQKKNCTKKV